MGALVARVRRGVIGGPSQPTSRELAAAFGVLAMFAAPVFAPLIANGGFVNDDWAYHKTYWYGSEDGFLEKLGAFDWFRSRPGFMLYWPLTHGLFGADASLHLAFTVLLTVAVAAAVYGVLRAVGLTWPHAGAIAALALVYPDSDATKLWAGASVGNAAIATFLFGLLAAIYAFRSSGRRAQLLHALSMLLYVASLSIYESTLLVVLAVGAVYLLVAEPRRAVVRWGADVVVVAVITAVLKSDPIYDPLPVGDLPDETRRFVAEGSRLIADSVSPFVTADRFLVAAVALALAVGIVWWIRGGASVSERSELRRWLLLAVAGACIVVLGWAIWIPAGQTAPLSPGAGNRVNALPGLGILMVAYSGLMLAGLLAARVTRLPMNAATAVALVGAALLMADYTRELRRDIDDWTRSATLQRQAVASIRSALPAPPADAMILAFGAPVSAAPGVQVFAAVWDLDGALKHAFDTPRITGLPVPPESRVDCRAGEVLVRNYNDAFQRQAAPYRAAIFVDVPAHRAEPVSSRRDCQAALRTVADELHPGSVAASEELTPPPELGAAPSAADRP